MTSIFASSPTEELSFLETLRDSFSTPLILSDQKEVHRSFLPPLLELLCPSVHVVSGQGFFPN